MGAAATSGPARFTLPARDARRRAWRSIRTRDPPRKGGMGEVWRTRDAHCIDARVPSAGGLPPWLREPVLLEPRDERTPRYRQELGGARPVVVAARERGEDPALLPSAARRLAARSSRSAPPSAAGAGEPAGASGASSKKRWSAPISLSPARGTARSTTLRSSRTLPGQPCASSRASAARSSDGAGRPMSRAVRAANMSASSRTSSLRSRSGGTVTVIPFRRK